MGTQRQAPSIFAALPDLFTAGLLLCSWIFPTWFGPAWIRNLSVALVVEFVLTFALTVSLSAAWDGEGPTTPERRRNFALGLVLLFPFLYLLVPWEKNLGLSASAFAWLLFTRMFDIAWHSGRGAVEGKRLVVQTAFGFLIFLPLLIIVSKLPHVALGGFTPEFMKILYPHNGAGTYSFAPERLSLFGVIYYVLQAALKFWMDWLALHPVATWLPAPPTPQPKLSPAEDSEGSEAAAERLARSGYRTEDISRELQKWRGLSAAEADKIANHVSVGALVSETDQPN